MAPRPLAPSMLLATPTLADTFFENAVILLFEANGEGAMGVVINRPLDLSVVEVSASLAIPVRDEYQDGRVYLGGPVAPRHGWVLAQRNDETPAGLNVRFEFDGGLMLLTDLDALRRLMGAPGQEFRLILGYSGWGPDQLQDEMKEGAWVPQAMDRRAPFRDPASLWETLLGADGLMGEHMLWGKPIHDA